MLMENKRQHIYLAALLHDIGKFYQRADRSFSDVYAELSDYSKNLANDICPVNDKGRFGYQHVVWTNEFLIKNKAILDAIPYLKENLYDTTNEDCIENLACNHHKPQTFLQALISMADWWSAGIDRQKASELDESKEADDKIKWGKHRYKKIPLNSIFNNIEGGSYNMAFPLTSFDISAEQLPKVIDTPDNGNSSELYYKLWKKFSEEFVKLPSDSLKGFTESLLFLLKKYTWSIPSNTMDMANVSLYDHLKTTAAFADCLYEYSRENPDAFLWNNADKSLKLKDDKLPILLLGCDLSGIQKFIYNISSRKAASSLKGRSFYLQLMIDSIIQKIISDPEIDATIGHVVYSSGGKFYMLLPNTNKVVQSIDKISKEIEKEVWKEHKGSIIVNIAYVPFAYVNRKNEINFEGAQNKDLGELWKVLSDKLIEQKNKKFNHILLDEFDSLFNPELSGGDVEVCAVTGIEMKKGEYKTLPKSDTVVSNQVYEQIKLGEVLKDADYLITYKDKSELSTYLSSKLKNNTTIFGIANYLFDDIQLVFDDADFRKISLADVSRVKRINNVAFTSTPLKGQKASYGFQFYGGNKQAYNKNANRDKTFEELTEVEEGNKDSETYFGVLRMDVDGLGKIFINGIPDRLKTFSAYATLSSHLDWFFSGYLNTIKNKYKNYVNILYSGGDDVFAVGRWDMLISFAEDIRKEFRKFTGREDISISGGVVLVGNKYPISKAADLSGVAVSKAKHFNNNEKNALNVFGENISWMEEFEYVKKFKNEFSYHIKENKMSRAILHKIMQLNKMLRNGDMSYLWHTAYYLKRFAQDKNEEVKHFTLNILQKELLTKRNYELIAIAARWAELETREIN